MGLMNDFVNIICYADNALYIYKLSGVYAELAKGISINSEGASVSNDTLLIIPFKCKCAENYKPPKEWERLTAQQKANYYTIREGDTVLINDDPVDIWSIEDIKNKYDNCFDIKAIKIFDKLMPHFEVSCR